MNTRCSRFKRLRCQENNCPHTNNSTPTATASFTFDPSHIFSALPDDLWFSLIGPQLHARDLVSLSMVSTWTHRIVHQVLTHKGDPIEVQDKSPDLNVLREVTSKWSHLRLKFVCFELQTTNIPDDNELDPKFLAKLDFLGKHVTDLVLADPRRLRSFDFLASNRLTGFYLAVTPLTELGAVSFGQQLQNNTMITTLRLFNNRVREQWWPHIFVGLATNKSIKSLEIKECFRDQNLCQALSETLSANTALTDVNLPSNHFGVNGGNWIGETLKVNTTITSLGMDGNRLGDEGVQLLCEGFKANNHVMSLSLAENGIQAAGVRSLSHVLSFSSITTLDLATNEICDESVKCLAEALSNCAIVKLDLSSNLIGDEGAKSLALLIQSDTTLKSLTLSMNRISNLGLRSLADALATFSSLSHLDVKGNPYSEESASVLVTVLHTNTSLTSLLVDIAAPALEMTVQLLLKRNTDFAS